MLPPIDPNATFREKRVSPRPLPRAVMPRTRVMFKVGVLIGLAIGVAIGLVILRLLTSVAF